MVIEGSGLAGEGGGLEQGDAWHGGGNVMIAESSSFTAVKGELGMSDRLQAVSGTARREGPRPNARQHPCRRRPQTVTPKSARDPSQSGVARRFPPHSIFLNGPGPDFRATPA
jgi:hypothetical protein